MSYYNQEKKYPPITDARLEGESVRITVNSGKSVVISKLEATALTFALMALQNQYASDLIISKAEASKEEINVG